MHKHFEKMPKTLVDHMGKLSTKFDPVWVYRQWYTGMPVEYLVGLMDELDQEITKKKAGG